MTWVAPVSDAQVFHCFEGTVNLEAAATDDIAVNHVYFDRWDAVNSQWVSIYQDYSAPYQATVDCGSLNYDWNQVDAYAADGVGNWSTMKYVWIYRDRPIPDVVPAQWYGWEYPIVPASTTGTTVVDTLHTGYPTYFDWGLTNQGTASTGTSTPTRLYLDDTIISDTNLGEVGPGGSLAYIDWWYTIAAPGWHTLRLDTDWSNAVAESNEANNSWQGQFYWTHTAPLFDDLEGNVDTWSTSGLWHLSTSFSFSGTHSWWYGQEATNTYDTDAANAGDLTSPQIYIPGTGYYLRFKYLYQTETASTGWDQRWVQISADNGPFENVLQLSDDPMSVWLDSQVVDLSPYSGRTIRVRFRFDTIDSVLNQYTGWVVDNFDISTTPPPVCPSGLEPNDMMAQASLLAIGSQVDQQICPGGDADFYTFDGVSGQTRHR